MNNLEQIRSLSPKERRALSYDELVTLIRNMTSDEIMRMPDTQSLLIFSNQRPIKATKAFQFNLFPGADHLVELKQNDYTSKPSGSQVTKFNEANKKWEAELAKAKATRAKNDVKPEEEEDMQDELDQATKQQKTIQDENEDVDF